MIYLASAYSHPDPLIMKTRFLMVEEATAELLRKKQVVFSPIVHTHELAIKYKLPTDFDFWRGYCLQMLKCASELVVFAPDESWRESRGVMAEIDFAERFFIPIFFLKEATEYGTVN